MTYYTGTPEELAEVTPTELMRRQAACDEIQMYAEEAMEAGDEVEPKDIMYALKSNGLI